MPGLLFPRFPILSRKRETKQQTNKQKKPKNPTKNFLKKRQQRVVFIWCLLFKFFKLRKAGDIFIRFCAKINEWQ
jgi:hypothetical protein